MIKIKATRVVSVFARIRGLMFVKNIKPIYFETRCGIHTFFMKQNIIVLILDSNLKVIKKRKLPPGRVFLWNPKYYRVLELPVNRETEMIKIGSVIKLE